MDQNYNNNPYDPQQNGQQQSYYQPPQQPQQPQQGYYYQQPQQGYYQPQQQGYYQPPQPQPNRPHGLSIASFACGIASCVLSGMAILLCCLYYVGIYLGMLALVPGVTGLILGNIGYKKRPSVMGQRGKTLSLVGTIVGGVAVVLSFTFIVLLFAGLFSSLTSAGYYY